MQTSGWQAERKDREREKEGKGAKRREKGVFRGREGENG